MTPEGDITASSFELKGGVIREAVTIEGDLAANSIAVPSGGPYKAEINSSGFARFTSASIAGFNIGSSSIGKTSIFQLSSSINTSDPVSFISSSKFKVSAGGDITGSDVLFTGGKIAGWDINGNILQNDSANLRLNGRASSPKITIGHHTVGSGAGIQLGYDGSGVLTFFAGECANDFFKYVAGTGISAKTDNFILTTDGDITGSQVLFTGGRIAGFDIVGSTLQSTNARMTMSAVAGAEYLSIRNSDGA